MSDTIVLSPAGKKKLEEELEDLKKNKRKQVAERISTAKEFGDLSENAE
jgi:transcription elongation factor GreA